MKKPVSENALVKRLNRHLAKLDLNLRKCPAASPWRKSLGNYYLIDTKQNAINGMNVDIAALARREGVLKSSEDVAL